MQPANEIARSLRQAIENKKIKICGNKKGSYLCNPKTGGAEKRKKPGAISGVKLKKLIIVKGEKL